MYSHFLSMYKVQTSTVNKEEKISFQKLTIFQPVWKKLSSKRILGDSCMRYWYPIEIKSIKNNLLHYFNLTLYSAFLLAVYLSMSWISRVACTKPSQPFSPRYARFSPFFARFVTLSPTCSLSSHIIHNYATLCNIICQLNYRRKNGRSRRLGGENAAIYRRGLHNVA